MIYFAVGGYLLALGIASFFIKETKATRIIRVLLAFVPLLLLCSFKSTNVGNDTSGYHEMFLTVRNYSIGQSYRQMETGFTLYTTLLAKTGMPFPLYLLISYSFLYVPLILLNFKYIKFPELSAICVLFFQFLNFHISGMRQSIAIGICLIGVLFLWKQKWHWALRMGLFVLPILLAFFFHRSALVALAFGPLFILRKKKLPSPLFYVPIFLIAALLSPYLYGALFKLTQDFLYYDAPSSHFFMALGFSTYIAIGVLVFCNTIYVWEVEPVFSRKPTVVARSASPFSQALPGGASETEQDEFFRFSFWAVFVEVFSVCMFSSSQVFSRIIFYFIPFFGPTVAMSVNCIRKRRILIPSYIAISVLFGVYFYFATIRTGYLHIDPYEFYSF